MEKDAKMFWTGLSPDEAREALVNKDKSMRDKRMTLKEAVSEFVNAGDNVGIGGFVNVRQPIAIIHEIIRKGFKDLILSFHSAGMAPELLAGAMMVRPDHCSIKRIELAYWGHEGFGLSQAWRYLAERGMIEFEDWSNYNMSARFKAGAMGLPFIPTRGPLGGDICNTSRTKVIDCPFTGRPIGLLPASNPNVGLIHVQAADMYGNCIIRGTDATCAEIAMASAHTIVTCEQLVSHELLVTNPKDIMIPFPAVDAVVKVPFGAYPGACRRHYYFNSDHILEFLGLIAPICKGGSSDALKAWYDEFIFGVESFEDYIDKFQTKKLFADQAAESYNCERLA
ncbi:MAG: CoA transferase subunit A [Proteobacteria bacterium]|nr:CoA transferase subunit A [Pseudomonadota bacterium]MBU4009257.1 CoA transferase subunit A [Pseudomonadota bacterium]MBU4037813.1 CoA transferase subunit A [Pseudomonadota bacterium]